MASTRVSTPQHWDDYWAGQAEDLGFMYMRGYFDLDGHGWGVNWMDPAASPPA